MAALFDRLIKGPIFGCQQCGQCVLSQTGWTCPMTCPKGLRNGPCGGTVNGACEVLPDRPCVWVDIRSRVSEQDRLSAPLEQSLIGTSSVLNYITGRDLDTRVPQSFYSEMPSKIGRPSDFATRFGTGKTVITYEIPSPRDRRGLGRVKQSAERLRQHVEAINTTTNAGGVPSLHSLETARIVAASGVPPIVQYCGRDQDAAAFRREVGQALGEGFANILAVTGDWNPDVPKTLNSRHWFPMDSLQMVDLLAGQLGHTKRPFIGVASTAYMTPLSLSVERFLTKLQAGADFTQTQVVTETERFSQWLGAVRATQRGRQCRILVSVPLVGKPGPLKILSRLAGVELDPAFVRSLEYGNNMVDAGIGAARHLIRRLLKLDVDGVHLVNFGVPLGRAIELIEEIRSWDQGSSR